MLVRILGRQNKPRKTTFSYRPRLDELEERCCPTAHITLDAQVLPGHLVQLSGTVTDNGNVGGYHVMLSGAAFASATTDSSGNFSCVSGMASLGTVYANAMNDLLQTTDSAQATIAVPAPNVTLAITYGAQGSVTLSGQLTDIDAAGQFIRFGGAAMGTVMTDGSGQFDFTTTPLSSGEIDASEIDAWGQSSNTADVMASTSTTTTTTTSSPPAIEDFEATQGANGVWTFTGIVIDSNPTGLIVRLGGLMSLVGQMATVQADGTFSLTCNVSIMDLGHFATAITTDGLGLTSNTAQAFVSA